jgi:phosphatidylglycerol:prolipoprotein diacylglycerol transferase
MKITPNPMPFSIGPIPIYWYGILIASALLIGTILVLKEAEKQGLNQEHLLDAILFAVPAAFVGARLYYVLFNWDYYYRYPLEIPAVWHGGLAIHGGLIGGILAAYFVIRKYKINFWQAIDIAAPSIVLGQAIGRWGNFFNQEAYGYEVDPAVLPWAMYIDGAYRHPTFLYESLWDFGVFLFLLWLRRRKGLKWGDVFLSYAVLYSVGRFFIEGLRMDSLMLTPSLRMAQVISTVIIVVSLSLIYYRHHKKNKLEEKN